MKKNQVEKELTFIEVITQKFFEATELSKEECSVFALNCMDELKERGVL